MITTMLAWSSWEECMNELTICYELNDMYKKVSFDIHYIIFDHLYIDKEN